MLAQLVMAFANVLMTEYLCIINTDERESLENPIELGIAKQKCCHAD